MEAASAMDAIMRQSLWRIKHIKVSIKKLIQCFYVFALKCIIMLRGAAAFQKKNIFILMFFSLFVLINRQ